jgi:hypothetical protein
MRKTVLIAAIAFTMLPLAGLAQQAPEMIGTSPPPEAGAAPPPATGAPPRDVAPQTGSPLLPGGETGLDKVASDGVSTVTVKAAPCGAAARETDGFTTCVGIPAEPARKH